jgi:hypothetical protein
MNEEETERTEVPLTENERIQLSEEAAQRGEDLAERLRQILESAAEERRSGCH